MFNQDRSIQTECLKEILENCPDDLISHVLTRMRGQTFEEGDTYFTQHALTKIWKESVLAEEFMDIYDEHAGCGRVHIFFYQLNDQQYIPLRNENKVREILSDETGNLINKKLFVWDSNQPKLAEIRHHFSGGYGELLFKWVESRQWDERVSGGTAASPPEYVRRTERSVNYFIINLRDGTAQLRIQLIKQNALKSLKKEYEIYQREIEKFIDFNKFKRIPLESVVRKLLTSLEIKNPKAWELWLPGGGWIRGKGKLRRYKIIGLGMRLLRVKLFGRKIQCEWEIKNREWGDSIVETKVNGEKDALTIMTPCDTKQMAHILGKVMDIGKNTVKDGILKKFVKKYNLLERIALSFDYHLNHLKKEEITAGHLVDSEWFQQDRVIYAIKLLCEAFPKAYICTGSGKKMAVSKVR